MTCIYSTLIFVAKQARTHHVTPVLTFDQPLWWKAMTIVETPTSDLQDIVLILGAFHTQMSFLGTIGHLMSGTGLEEALEQLYAGNTVGHIMSGRLFPAQCVVMVLQKQHWLPFSPHHVIHQPILWQHYMQEVNQTSSRRKLLRCMTT
jgi:hypothetical protein